MEQEGVNPPRGGDFWAPNFQKKFARGGGILRCGGTSRGGGGKFLNDLGAGGQLLGASIHPRPHPRGDWPPHNGARTNNLLSIFQANSLNWWVKWVFRGWSKPSVNSNWNKFVCEALLVLKWKIGFVLMGRAWPFARYPMLLQIS